MLFFLAFPNKLATNNIGSELIASLVALVCANNTWLVLQDNRKWHLSYCLCIMYDRPTTQMLVCSSALDEAAAALTRMRSEPAVQQPDTGRWEQTNHCQMSCIASWAKFGCASQSQLEWLTGILC